MSEFSFLKEKFSYFNSELIEKIEESSVIKSFPSQTELVKEGEYIKYVPIVLSGLVKVYVQNEEKEILLYYIKPEQSCIMSFSSVLNDATSKIFAVTEEETNVLLIPSQRLLKWILEFPVINKLFYQEYELRYSEMVSMINQLMYKKLDQRIEDYLHQKKNVTGKNPMKISHKEIANDLGTAREVISRILKKMEAAHKIKQTAQGIEIL